MLTPNRGIPLVAESEANKPQAVNEALAVIDGQLQTLFDTPIPPETIQDSVAAFLMAGDGLNLVYDDPANTLTFINAAPLSTEAVQDIVGAMAVAGTNISTTYNDATGALTFNAIGDGTGFSTEDIHDIIAAVLVPGANITIAYNDPGGTITVTASGSTSSTQRFTTLASTAGTVTLDATQYTPDFILITGNLTGNLTYIFPDSARQWRITNRASHGAFTLFVQIGSDTPIQVYENDVLDLINPS